MLPSKYIRKGWCQGVYAMDRGQQGCHAEDPFAVAWCIQGAVLASKLSGTLSAKKERALLNLVMEFVGWHPAAWNDALGRTQDEVASLLESCEAKLGLGG